MRLYVKKDREGYKVELDVVMVDGMAVMVDSSGVRSLLSFTMRGELPGLPTMYSTVTGDSTYSILQYSTYPAVQMPRQTLNPVTAS